jgi:DcrB
VVGGAVLVASLAASCASNDSSDAAANQQSTTVALTTIPRPVGPTVRGTGYRFSLPTGWRDATSEVKKTYSEQVDLAVSGTTTGGIASNLNVVIQPSQGATADEIVAATLTQLDQASEDLLVAGRPEHLSLAGAPALAHEYTFRVGRNSVRGRQVICLRDDSFYAVTFLAHSDAFSTDRAAFDQIISSWAWE